jgi:hypothetical protein
MLPKWNLRILQFFKARSVVDSKSSMVLYHELKEYEVSLLQELELATLANTIVAFHMCMAASVLKRPPIQQANNTKLHYCTTRKHYKYYNVVRYNVLVLVPSKAVSSIIFLLGLCRTPCS